jgi:hypothetical protein
MTIYLVISLPKIPYIHHIYMVLANLNYEAVLSSVSIAHYSPCSFSFGRALAGVSTLAASLSLTQGQRVTIIFACMHHAGLCCASHSNTRLVSNTPFQTQAVACLGQCV